MNGADELVYTMSIDGSDVVCIQKEVDAMKAWADKWLMEYHPKKCKCYNWKKIL